jgi:hypothetical protein
MRTKDDHRPVSVGYKKVIRATDAKEVGVGEPR